MNPVEAFLFGGAVLLIISVLASKATGRLGVPALLVFLAIGILAGSEGVGGIYFDNAFYAQTLGVIALIYILFSGGLDTDLSTIRGVARSGVSLATLGVFLTCVLTGAFAKFLFGFSWVEGFLIGAIVSSTDAAAVFSILRTRGVNLKGNLKPLLELESGSNDPMAVFLTTAFLLLLQQDGFSPWILIPKFFQQMILGGVFGVLLGKAAVWALNRIKLESEGLYAPLTLAYVLLVYTLTQAVGGNGFLSVYVCGLTLSSQNFIHKKSLILFHDGIAWIMQIAMFLTLGLLVFPSRLLPVAGLGLLLSVFLIFVARPVSVHVAMAFSRASFREKALISWVGLRGAVPIVLATFPLLAGIDKADTIFNLIFFVVLTSVLIQGSTIPLVAKLLKVDAPFTQKFRYPIEYVPTDDLKSSLAEVPVPRQSPAVGKSVIDLRLPSGALIVLIQRKGRVLVPRGGTVIESDDTLLVLAEDDPLEQTKRIVKEGSLAISE